jgi:4-hydroxy 2-oxovalerate aldolase
MAKNDIKLLDCTLRDGGYINSWKWGFHSAKAIIRLLTKAKVDFCEVGFLRNVDGYNENITVCNTIEELNKLLPNEMKGTVYSAMAMHGNYNISKLSPYSGYGIEMIRITAHDYDIEEGMDFAREVKEKGYKLSINPINIMGYSDKTILQIIDLINQIRPYQFSIVDTFGSMKRRDLDRIVSLVDNNLDNDIRVALHLHENMALSFSLAQQFVEKNLNRPLAIDGSLLGMGRIPGNLPIELIADYLNDYEGKTYDIDYMMDAIQDYVEPLKGKTEWGYSPAYFLSARFNLHRNYAEYYLGKGDLTNRDINHILSGFDKNKKTVFDSEYADKLYMEYKNNSIDDSNCLEQLKCKLMNKEIILIAPGYSVKQCCTLIKDYISAHNAVAIGVNFIPDNIKVDYGFFSNNKRFNKISNRSCEIIITSNLHEENTDYIINYNRLASSFEQGYNSLVMLIKLLKEIGINKIVLAGADGYVDGGDNYCDDLFSKNVHGRNSNMEIANAIKKLNVKIECLTPSVYNI